MWKCLFGFSFDDMRPKKTLFRKKYKEKNPNFFESSVTSSKIYMAKREVRIKYMYMGLNFKKNAAL